MALVEFTSLCCVVTPLFDLYQGVYMYRLHMCAMPMFRTWCETEFSKMFVRFRLSYNTDCIIAKY